MLYVETHWILSCVLQQDAEAPTLLRPGNNLQICIPAFCIPEAIARFRTLEKEARGFRGQLAQNRREASRMRLDVAKRLTVALETAIREQDYLIEQLPAEIGTFMEEFFSSPIEQIPADREAIRRANALVQTHDMSRGDALILATVLDHATRNTASKRAFLTGNTRDFGIGTPAGGELSAAEIKVFSKVSAALGFMSATTVAR